MAAPSSAVPAGAAPSDTAAAQDIWAAPEGAWTVPDLRGVPRAGQRYEIIDGCLHATPQPGAEHRHLVGAIVEALRGTAPPHWYPVSQLGVLHGDSLLVPDAVVLRPGAPEDPTWADASDVALVVEFESPHSRRVARCLKPTLYAEAGIESYWRIECTANGPVAHLYTGAAAGHYQSHRSVHPGQCVTAELPYAVQVAPAAWH